MFIIAYLLIRTAPVSTRVEYGGTTLCMKGVIGWGERGRGEGGEGLGSGMHTVVAWVMSRSVWCMCNGGDTCSSISLYGSHFPTSILSVHHHHYHA